MIILLLSRPEPIMLLELPIMLLSIIIPKTSLLCSKLCFPFLKTSSYLTRPNNALIVLLEYTNLSIGVDPYKTNIHHVDRRNTIQCIATISPIQWITILPHMQIITMCALGGDCTIRLKFSPIMLALCLMLFFTYYAQNYAGIIGSSLLKSYELLGAPHR